MHYTSVPNILKVLNPPFLDDLRTWLQEAGYNVRMLLNLRRRMAKIRVSKPSLAMPSAMMKSWRGCSELVRLPRCAPFTTS
jgi:hypothetical protein